MKRETKFLIIAVIVLAMTFIAGVNVGLIVEQQRNRKADIKRQLKQREQNITRTFREGVNG